MKKFEIFSKGKQFDTITTSNLPQYGIEDVIDAESADEALDIFKKSEQYEQSLELGFSDHIALEVNSPEYNKFINTHYIVDDTVNDLIHKGFNIHFSE